MKKYCKFIALLLALNLVVPHASAAIKIQPIYSPEDVFDRKTKEMNDFKVVRKSMGGFIGKTYCNHEKALAFTLGIGSGVQYVGVDLMLTTDGKLVCSHGVDKKTCKYNGTEYKDKYKNGISYKDFMKLKIQGMFKPLTVERWKKYVIKYKRSFWELDLGNLNKDKSIEMAKAIVSLFEGNVELFDKFLIQVDNKEMFEGVNSVYNFKHYQYLINTKTELKDIDNILKFCNDNGITSISINYKYLDQDLVNKIKKANLRILCYTIEDKELAQKMLDMGVDAVYSNFLFESDFFEDKNDDIY